jgi:hypothetical protein
VFEGGFAGGTIGGNFRFQNFVVGVEGEGAWSDIGQSASGFFVLVTATDRIQAFGSLTGRLRRRFRQRADLRQGRRRGCKQQAERQCAWPGG